MLLQQFCRERGGFEPRIEYPTEDVAMTQPLIAAGLAVALLLSLNLARPHPGVTVRELPDAPPGRDIWCVGPANRRLPAAPPMVEALMRGAAPFLGRQAGYSIAARPMFGHEVIEAQPRRALA